MRRMWFAVAAFLLVTVLCIYERIISDNISQEICSNIDYSIKLVQENNIDGALACSEQTQNIWREKQKILFLFIPHNQFNNFEEYINSSSTFLQVNDYRGFLLEAKKAQENLKRITSSSKLNLENII